MWDCEQRDLAMRILGAFEHVQSSVVGATITAVEVGDYDLNKAYPKGNVPFKIWGITVRGSRRRGIRLVIGFNEEIRNDYSCHRA